MIRPLFYALLSVALIGCSESGGVAGSDRDARVLAQAVARPAALAAAMPFDVEITATNVSTEPISLTMTSGCSFSYEVQAPDGRVIAAPVYPCTAVMRSLTLVAGEVLRETYRYETGEVTFPRLPSGSYRIVPSLNVRNLPGLVVRAAMLEVR